MAIEDAGANPQCMAAAILDQIPNGGGPVPIKKIASALDILHIRSEPLVNMEGALVAPAERGYGAILTNASSSRQRQRFTIGHELMHFLSPWHVPTGQGGFQCSKKDMAENPSALRRVPSATMTRHKRQEAEANRFAIELLAPFDRIRTHLQAEPDFDHVIAMADGLEISREAAARRYVEKHDACIAIAFSQDNRLRYWVRQDEFPKSALFAKDVLPLSVTAAGISRVGKFTTVDPEDWFARPQNIEVQVQTFHQQNGYAMTLVVVERTDNDDDDDGEIEDAYRGFNRF